MSEQAQYGENDDLAVYNTIHGQDKAGWRERTDCGILALSGRDRATFLQGMVSNDILSVSPGQGCLAALLDSTAHLLAMLSVLCLPDRLLFETDAVCLDKLAQTLDKYLIMEKVRIENVTPEWSIISLQGAEALTLADSLPLGDTGAIVPRRHSLLPGCDLWIPISQKDAVSRSLTAAGTIPISDALWETLRIEAGLPRWGHELTESVLLPEAGLVDYVSYTKGCYVGQEIVARVSARGHANRGLRSVLLAEGEAVPSQGDTVHLPEQSVDSGREIGRITSATRSPLFHGRALALAYVRHEYFEPGTDVEVHLSQPDGTVFRAPGAIRMPGE